MNIDLKGVSKLEQKLRNKSETDFQQVVEKNIRDVYRRSQRSGGTPVGDYKGGGQLRLSAQYRGDTIGYTVHYAPHVEYGHRQEVGRYVPAIGKRLVKPFVPGKYFLKRNVDTQRPLYKQDLINKLKE